MDNIIATLPERMAEATASASKYDSPTQAVTIKSAARECFNAFSDDEGKSVTRVKMVLGWIEAGFTPGEVDKILSEALLMAKETDIAMGFKSEGKKGRAAYGLNQSVMSSRASECRAVYGAGNQGALPFLKEKGWQAALNTARMWLDEKGKLWDGDNKPSKEQRAAKKAAKEHNKAFMEAAAANPMRAGESIADYAARVAKESAVVNEQKAVETILATFKKWDDGALQTAIHEYLLGKGPDQLRMYAAQLNADADNIEKQQDIDRAARSEEPAPF